MQLFVLGPAFGLPSIDAECIAAVAFLQLHVPDGYALIPTHDTRHRLPLLRDGEAQVTGFSNIIHHLTSHPRLDGSNRPASLGAQLAADALAATSFLHSAAPALLDVSLYVSFENYRHTTRPAFTKILPWHANYIVPPQRRAAARVRTEHLGIAAIDVDTVHEDTSDRPDAASKEQNFEAAMQKKTSLLLPRKDTLSSLLRRSEHAAAFKLHALADSLFEPLQDLLAGKTFLLSDRDIHAVDCLAYGYISLMLYPDVPQKWLATTLTHKYPALHAYISRLHARLALQTTAEEVVTLRSPHTTSLSLPWQPALRAPLPTTLYVAFTALRDQIPFLDLSASLTLLDAPRSRGRWHTTHLPAILAVSTSALAALGFLAFHTRLLTWPHGAPLQVFGRRRLADFDHLGAALAGLRPPTF